MSISDKIQALEASRQAIATAIEQKGGTVAQGDGFSQFATEISNLPSGGSGNPLLTSIDVSDFSGTTFNRATSYITDVTIPSGVTSLGGNAFAGLSNITSITIPNTVTYIGQYAFQNCIGLTSITIPNSVTTIDNNAFVGCSYITNLTIGNHVTSIGNSAFQNCSRLESVVIPDSVTSIGNSAFNTGNSNPMTFFIGSGVTTIGYAAFYANRATRHIVCTPTTPPTLKEGSAFRDTNNCPIYVPAESVDAYKAASSWSEYVSRIYPIQQVATVDGNPVYNYDLRNTDSTVISDNERSKIPTGDVIEFAEGVTQIGGQLGAYEEVIMPSTFKSFDDTQPINAATTTLTCKATIPPGVEGNNLGGSGLTAIYVPSAKVDAYKSAAWGWSTFASIIQAIPEDVKPAFKFTSSVDSSKDITVNCEDTATAGTLTTNDLGMSSQQMDEFKSAENTGSVEIGDCVKIYRATNCYTAKGISEVKLNEGLERIEDFAFGGMSALREITIPSTVTNISYQAFYADRALQGITCLATTPPTLGSDVFGDTNNCPIYVPAESVDTYKTAWTQYADRIQSIPAE